MNPIHSHHCKTARQASIIAATALTLTACSNSARPPTAPHIELNTVHFTIASDDVDTAAVRTLAAALEQNRPRILADLQTTSLGATHVVIQSKQDFDSAWHSTIQRSGIAFQVQGLTGPDGTIYIYGPWAATHSGRPLQQVALHELAHAVTNRLAVGHATPPRWLSETIAVYEAKQATDLNHYFYLLRGRYPSIADLNDPTKSFVYEIGYRLAEYIRARWGADAVVRLVQHDGDVQATLGVSNDQLMHDWFIRVENRYLLIKPQWFGGT